MTFSGIDRVFLPKPETGLRIYAYSIADQAHDGLVKVGQTTRDVRIRVSEQLRTAAIANFCIHLDVPAVRDDGTIFTDRDVRAALVHKGFQNTTLEWMRCTVEDVKTVLEELRSGSELRGIRHETFGLRAEQRGHDRKREAVMLLSWLRRFRREWVAIGRALR